MNERSRLTPHVNADYDVPPYSTVDGDDSETPEAKKRWVASGATVHGLVLPLGGSGERLVNLPDWGVQDCPAVATVLLQRDSVRALDAYVTSDVRARVTFGVGGAGKVVVDCDWAHGTQLTAPATTIYVDAIGFNPHAESAYGGQPFTLRADVATSGRGGSLPPRYSVPFLLDPAEVLNVRIPQFAARVAVLAAQAPAGTSGYTGDLSLRLGDGPTLVYSAPVVSAAPIPLNTASPGLARIVNGGAVAYRGKLLFELVF